jgi:hypothetical protein
VTEAAATSSHPPDWTAINREILCPLCGYNLRGLIEPRCPECGYRFDWHALLNPPPRHPYLFEHHPDRNVRSFFHTLVAGLRPRRFWKELQPIHAPRLLRLILYWLLATALMPLAALPEICKAWEGATLGYSVPFGYWLRILDRAISHSDLWVAGVIVAWPWLTYLTLAIFRVSFARARLRQAHALRCALYSGDAALWIAILLVINAGWLRGLVPSDYRYLFGAGRDALIAALFLFALTGYRLAVACRHYLRLDHPRAMALSTQVIILLLVWLVLLST